MYYKEALKQVLRTFTVIPVVQPVSATAQMPILTTPGGDDENDPYNVIFTHDVDSTTSPFCDDVIMTSSTGCQPEVSTTENDEVDDADDVDSDLPKRRGPKKQPMTKARLAKVKVRHFILYWFLQL